mmetsp:Transcript_20009/g.62910  ORF Transcript_20009/g.62910 Transcript_20009/m.62910 type:complete len:268 (+) Transcript_20009:39-842(+)
MPLRSASPRRRRRRRSPSSSPEPRRKRKSKWDDGAGAVPAVSKKQREVYVGNLNGSMSAEALRELFEQLMRAIPGYEASSPAVTNVQLCQNGSYGFVEFRDEQVASTAMKFHGLQIGGRAAKIGRPGGYAEPPTGHAQALDVPAAILEELGVSGVASSYTPAAGAVGLAMKKQRELYVGNLTAGAVTAPLLRNFLTKPLQSAIGSQEPLIMNVELEASGKFAFVEFRDEHTATLALQLFNNVDLCGRQLRLGRPSGYIDPLGGAALR